MSYDGRKVGPYIEYMAPIKVNKESLISVGLGITHKGDALKNFTYAHTALYFIKHFEGSPIRVETGVFLDKLLVSHYKDRVPSQFVYGLYMGISYQLRDCFISLSLSGDINNAYQPKMEGYVTASGQVVNFTWDYIKKNQSVNISYTFKPFRAKPKKIYNPRF